MPDLTAARIGERTTLGAMEFTCFVRWGTVRVRKEEAPFTAELDESYSLLICVNGNRRTA